MAKDAAFLSLDLHHAKKVLDSLARDVEALPKGMEKVVMRSLNRSIIAMRDETAKSLTEEYAVPQREVKAAMYIKKANTKRLVASLHAQGRMAIPLIHWKARQTSKGVSVKIKRQGKRSVVTHKKGKEVVSFISGQNAYARPEMNTLNVKRLYGPSFLSMLRRPEVIESQQRRAQDVFEKRVMAEANFLLSKVGKGVSK